MAFLQFGPRDRGEAHRASTTLELMFDLASVIAIAAAAAGLHHGVADGHALEALPSFLAAFFMIWWSWMNYTWFASAYDDGSPAFRILTMAAMFGALTIAAGVPAVFGDEPIYLSLIGFAIMRLAMALLWFGAAAGDPGHRKTARAYGVGILAMQVFWIALVLALPRTSPLYAPLFLVGLAGELAVPAIAEFRHGATAWHRRHIIERYGLLNIIVLGECFLSVAATLATGDHGAPAGAHAFLTAAASAVIAFSLWALYFTDEEHIESDALPRALLWGYGHFAIFAAGAATGAGFAAVHDVAAGHAAIGARAASFAVALPVAVYLLTLWVVRDRFCLKGWRRWILPAGAVAIALAPTLFAEALVPIAALAVIAASARRTPAASRMRA